MPSEHIHALPAGFCLHVKYELLRQIGYGNFGITYLAWDKVLERKVAIKELLPQDFAARASGRSTVVPKSASHEPAYAWAKDRFLKEARTLAKLAHPSIVTIIEQFEANSTAYIVMEFIEGDDLEDWFRKNPRPNENTLRVLTTQILQALSMVHQHGYLHRDIKPENIRMQNQMGVATPVLIDFGNARMSTGLKTENLSQIVTYGFAPFEQYQKSGRQGAWTDLYALGAVLYRGITGKVPPDAIERHGQDSIILLANDSSFQAYSTEFRGMIDKALRLRADQRWQTCTDWLDALKGTPKAVTKDPKFPLWIIALSVLVLGFLVAGGVVILRDEHKQVVDIQHDKKEAEKPEEKKDEKKSEQKVDPPVPVPAPVPLIAVEQVPGGVLSAGQKVDFERPVIGTTITRKFVIRNVGQAELSGLQITREGSADFAVSALEATSVTPQKEAGFSVSFTPRTSGSQNAVLHVASNASGGNGPFKINLTGGGVGVPEIEVEQGGRPLADNGSTLNFGGSTIGVATELEFSIKNIGTADLTGLAATLTGPALQDYTVAGMSSGAIAPGQTAGFKVLFRPGTEGERTATLRLASNVSGSRNPFDVNLRGLGVKPMTPAPPPQRANENVIGMKFASVPVKDYDHNGRETADLGTVSMGVYETTKNDYKTIVPSYEIVGDPGEPVVGLTDEEIDYFLAELSKRDGHRHRLPKDHEWSCAIGLKESSSDTSKAKSAKNLDVYPWPGSFSQRPPSFNYRRGNSAVKFVPVQNSGETQFGLFGMGGNAAELCTDGTGRVLRGGSAYTAPKTGAGDIKDPELLQMEFAAFTSSNRQRVLTLLLSDEKVETGQKRLNRDQIGFRCVREP